MSAARSKWLDWEPPRIFQVPATLKPSKPSELGIEGFEGLSQAESPKIEAARDQAVALLNRTGCRIMSLWEGTTIGVWRDQDGPEIRAALATIGMADRPIRYLDEPGIPIRYTQRRKP